MIGTEWRKWDLHVHTPASLEQGYGSNEDAWERFISDLEALPPEFKVIGVNDYLFIDGYERLLCEKKENNRLQNIETLLPVIEFRIDKFAGSGSAMRRVNYHVIFSESLDPNVIKQQFLSGLYGEYKISSDIGGLDFNAAITKASLVDLGQKHIENLPEKMRKGKSPLREGFSNINFPYEKIQE